MKRRTKIFLILMPAIILVTLSGCIFDQRSADTYSNLSHLGEKSSAAASCGSSKSEFFSALQMGFRGPQASTNTSGRKAITGTLHDEDMIRGKAAQNYGILAHDSRSVTDDSQAVATVEIDGIVTGFDASDGILHVEGIKISTCSVTTYENRGHALDREEFFARLRQGVSIVKVKWHPFTGYDQPPQKLQLES